MIPQRQPQLESAEPPRQFHRLLEEREPFDRVLGQRLRVVSGVREGRLRRGTKSLLAGFGVGFSWAGCLWTELWENKAVKTAADLEAA